MWYFVSAIIGVILGALGAYLTQKAKNKALIEDNEVLTESIESIKKDHALEFAKRKHQYESKSKQYFKYFELLDSVSGNDTQSALSMLPEMMANFTAELIRADNDQDKVADAISNYMKSVNTIMFNAEKNYIRLKQETSTLKLIASDNITTILKGIENEQLKNQALYSEMTNAISEKTLTGNDSALNAIIQKSQAHTDNITALKEELTQEVKKELNEI